MITAATTADADIEHLNEQALEFLRVLFDPEDIIEFRPLKVGEGRQSWPSKWATLDGVPALMPWVREVNSEPSRNMYFGANPRGRRGGTKGKDVSLARCVFVDIDGGVTLEEALARIDRNGLPMPTILTESGGGVHAWWRLTEPLTDLVAWKARQKVLIAALGGDKLIHDRPRVMRLPTTFNWKRQATARVVLPSAAEWQDGKIVGTQRHDFGSVIPAGDIEAEVGSLLCVEEEIEEQEAESKAEAVVIDTSRLPTLSMSDASHRFIHQGRLIGGEGRRATLFAVACDLKARGWDERTACDVLMERMSTVGLNDDELADCPRQIHNAFNEPRDPLPSRHEQDADAVGLNGAVSNAKKAMQADAAAKKAAQREAKKAAKMDAVVRAVGAGEAEPLDLRKEHTHDEVSAARRLAARAAGSLRYCVEWKKWLAWDGRRWRVDDGGAAIEAAKALRDELWAEFPKLERNQQDAAWQFLRGMGAAKRLAGVVSLASSEPAIRVRVEQLDRHPFVLCVRNGLLDLNSMELMPHDPGRLITQMAEVDYGEQAESALWERFIAEATDNDEELASFLQRAAGVALTGSVRDEILYCHYGRGANGKSTYLDAMRHLLGDYATVAPPSFLAHRNQEGHPTELAMMHGKRLVAAIEMEAGARMRESLVKSLTGGDAVQARRMREDFWALEPSWKVHVSFNDAPRVSGTDDGIKRRLCVIPWRVTFDGSRRDSTLKERLCADGDERGGILNWAIAGLRAWQIAGLAPPDCVRASTEDFTRQQDTFGQFLDERCEIDPGMRVESGDFYREFTQWLESRRESTATWTSNRVANELVRRNFVKESRRTGGIHRGKYFYAGVGLLSAHDR